MNANQIKSKLSSYAHAEFNNKFFNNFDKINYSIKNKLDLFDRPIKYQKVDFDETFPEYLYENRMKFKDWIL